MKFSRTTKRSSLALLLSAGLLAILPISPASAAPFEVDPATGNSNFSAVFDHPTGERINAVSSKITCHLDVDIEKGTAAGKCSVPLTSIAVDNEPVKSGHFQQWVTHKETEPKDCLVELSFQDAKVTQPVVKEEPLPFKGEAKVTFCGRPHELGKTEKLSGTAILIPPGDLGPTDIIRVRARIEGLDRTLYKIGPDWTPGWEARIQKLARVVARKGDIEISLFARASVRQ